MHENIIVVFQWKRVSLSIKIYMVFYKRPVPKNSSHVKRNCLLSFDKTKRSIINTKSFELNVHRLHAVFVALFRFAPLKASLYYDTLFKNTRHYPQWNATHPCSKYAILHTCLLISSVPYLAVYFYAEQIPCPLSPSTVQSSTRANWQLACLPRQWSCKCIGAYQKPGPSKHYDGHYTELGLA